MKCELSTRSQKIILHQADLVTVDGYHIKIYQGERIIAEAHVSDMGELELNVSEDLDA